MFTEYLKAVEKLSGIPVIELLKEVQAETPSQTALSNPDIMAARERLAESSAYNIDPINAERYQDHLYVEKQKDIWREEIKHYLLNAGYQEWLVNYALTNSIQLGNLLSQTGIPSGLSQKTAFLCMARPFNYLQGTPKEMREQDNGNRMREWENISYLNSLRRQDIATELNTLGVPTWKALNAISIQDEIALANALNGLGFSQEYAQALAHEVRPIYYQEHPKNVFGSERHGLGKLLSGVGRIFEIHHWKIMRELAKPLTKGPVKRINQEFENAIQEVQARRVQYLNEVDIAVANQRNLLQWQYGKGMSDVQTYQMNYIATYAPLDEMRVQLIVINLNDANNISIMLGNMQYEKSQHDIRLLNWKYSFELAEADIQLNVQKKKNEINHKCDKYAYQLSHEQYQRIEKHRRKGAKQLVVIVASSFIAPQIGQYLSATVSSSLGITSATAQATLTGALTGMAFSSVTGILSGDTHHLAQNMFRGAVLGGIGGYAGEYAKTVEVLKQSNALRTIFVAGVKATAGSLINHEKLGQGLVNQICQGLLLGESNDIPTEFFDILRDAMLRAGTSAFVDTLMHGGPLGDKLAMAGVSTFFQSLGEYAGYNLKFWIDARAKQKRYEQELDKPESTPMKALDQAGGKDDPQDLIAWRDSISNKANKSSAQGKQIEADNYQNAANVIDDKLYKKTHFNSSASFEERWHDITEFFKNKDSALLNDVIEPRNTENDGNALDRRDRLNELTEDYKRNLEIDRGAGLVDVLTFGLSKNVSQNIANTNSLGYKQGRLVGDALQGELIGAALLHYGGKALNLTIKHTKEFVKTHDFRSPIVFRYKHGLNEIRLNSGIPIDTITVEKRLPFLKKAELGDGVSRTNSAADAMRLKTELSFKQAGILDSEGKLTVEAARLSKVAWKDGSVVDNQYVKNILIKDGSKIEDWTKFATPSVELSNGQRVQIHYYKNKLTNKIDYDTPDFKIKGRVESLDGPKYWRNTEQEFTKNLFKNK